MRILFNLLTAGILSLLFTSCGSAGKAHYYLSHHPSDSKSRQLRHYPVARQGNLTAWLTSDHVHPSEKFLYAPNNPDIRFPIVGTVRSKDMSEASDHDGSFLIASGYDGPLFKLWQGTSAEGELFTGAGGWIHVRVHQGDGVNTWVRVAEHHSIGGWSGYPVVIGSPDQPDAIAGAMWYKLNSEPQLGGATSTRMLQRELNKLRLADFVKP